LAERWDGTRWTIVPSPNAGPNENILNSVSCTSPRRPAFTMGGPTPRWQSHQLATERLKGCEFSLESAGIMIVFAFAECHTPRTPNSA